MNIGIEELEAAGFRRAGTVFPDAANVVRVQIDWPVTGFVVYIMVVNDEFKKAGTTGRKSSTFEGRMRSTFGALRQVITGGSPDRPPVGWRSRRLDPFKQHAPATIRAGHKIELWAQGCTIDTFEVKETELNNKYRGEWTKEGWTKDGKRRGSDADAD